MTRIKAGLRDCCYGNEVISPDHPAESGLPYLRSRARFRLHADSWRICRLACCKNQGGCREKHTPIEAANLFRESKARKSGQVIFWPCLRKTVYIIRLENLVTPGRTSANNLQFNQPVRLLGFGVAHW